MAETKFIVLLLDSQENVCFPQTTGEAITVKVGTGEQKKEVNLDDWLNQLFSQVLSNIVPGDNLNNLTIGTKDKRFDVIYVKAVDATAVNGETIKGATSVEAPKIVAKEQLQINGITIVKNEAGRLQPNAGIEGAVWN